eukprot:1185157-Prorocentrum_minimum.AAC.1
MLTPLRLEGEQHAACRAKLVKNVMKGIQAKPPVVNNRKVGPPLSSLLVLIESGRGTPLSSHHMLIDPL